MLVRIKYGKPNAGRFLSHLDLLHAWERAIRRTGAPLAFSQGYNPHPKLYFGSALSVGTTSDGEYMDVELEMDIDAESFRKELAAALPPALTLLDMAVPPAKSAALMSIIDRARYLVTVILVQPLTAAELEAVIAQFLAQETVKVLRFKKNSREKREVDIRAGIFTLTGEVQQEGQCIVLEMLLKTGSEGNVKPDEVVAGLMQAGLPVVEDIERIHRLGLYVEQEGQLVSPLTYGWKE